MTEINQPKSRFELDESAFMEAIQDDGLVRSEPKAALENDSNKTS